VYALGDPRPTHQELRWGEAEALTLAALAGDPALARVREAATRDWLVEGLRDGRVVTASCHGEFDPSEFLRSRLLLANGEVLTLAEALGSRVDIAGLRLLVLSACQSAVMDVRGAQGEVRSLAVAMLQAGAQAVAGTLWAVDDRATYLLMVRFAQEWLPVMDEQSPARALMRAQTWLRTATNRDLAAWEAQNGPVRIPDSERDGSGLASVRGRGTRYTVAEAEQLITGIARRAAAGSQDDTPYSDPIFWAGFQVHGR
jgi:CHAT domain-containing protein